jgi:hypothetical protein
MLAGVQSCIVLELSLGISRDWFNCVLVQPMHWYVARVTTYQVQQPLQSTSALKLLRIRKYRRIASLISQNDGICPLLLCGTSAQLQCAVQQILNSQHATPQEYHMVYSMQSEYVRNIGRVSVKCLQKFTEAKSALATGALLRDMQARPMLFSTNIYDRGLLRCGMLACSTKFWNVISRSAVQCTTAQ